VSGQNLRKVGDIIFIIAILAILGVVVYMVLRSVSPAQRRDPILTQILIVMPILLIRTSFTAVQAFLSDEPNVWLNLGLVQIPDLFSDTIYTVYGLTLLKPAQRKKLIKEQKRVDEIGGVSRRRDIWERMWRRTKRQEDEVDEVKDDNP